MTIAEKYIKSRLFQLNIIKVDEEYQKTEKQNRKITIRLTNKRFQKRFAQNNSKTYLPC